MVQLKQYLLSVVAAAILCSIIMRLVGKKGALSAIVKLLTGLFLAVTVISPWAKLQIMDFSTYANGLSAQAQDAVEHGQAMAYLETSSIIKSRTEAYILDKAASLGLHLEVEVTVSGSEPPQPSAVTLRGAVSPYAKQQLQQIIAKDLGIPEGSQTWT